MALLLLDFVIQSGVGLSIVIVCGFRHTVRSAFIAMIAGILTAEIWKIFSLNACCNAVIPGIAINLVFLIGSRYLHFTVSSQNRWTGVKEKVPLLLNWNESCDKIYTWFYAATENLLWTLKKVYHYYDIYIIITYLIYLLFISKSVYFFDYKKIVLLWGCFSIGYPFMHLGCR